MQTSRLDIQLDSLGISYTPLAGLPRPPLSKPVFPVLAKINGNMVFCLMAESSILTARNLPKQIGSIEMFGSERQRSLSKSLGLDKITLLCGKTRVYFDARLLEAEVLTLPVGDKTSYLQVKTQDLAKAIGDLLIVTHYPQLNITPDEFLDGSDFSRKRVHQAMDEVNSIPPFPVTARSIIEMNMRDELDIDKLAAVIEKDAPIVSNLLSWASSASYTAARMNIASVHDAIARLGTRTTMNFALQASMMKSFRASKSLAPLVQFASFNSLHSAYGARLISETRNPQKSNHAYLTGLMHNLGELLMVHRFPERSLEYMQTQEANPHLSREVLSREVLKVSFANCTDLLMEAWDMPSVVAEASRALASYQDAGQNDIAEDIRLWQIMMLDAGRLPYAHAPHGWEKATPFPTGKDLIKQSEGRIQEFLSFSSQVALGVR